jgi:hypothetical protein
MSFGMNLENSLHACGRENLEQETFCIIVLSLRNQLLTEQVEEPCFQHVANEDSGLARGDRPAWHHQSRDAVLS